MNRKERRATPHTSSPRKGCAKRSKAGKWENILSRPLLFLAFLFASSLRAFFFASFAVKGFKMDTSLTAGAARVNITPPLTIPYLGFVPRHAFFEGVHDPLHARAVVVGDGRRRIALLSADGIGFGKHLAGEGRDFTAEVRERVHAACGIPPDHTMITATHAHSTPETTGLRRMLDNPGAAAWIQTLQAQLASAVALADRDRAPARLKHAIGRAEGLAWSRRIVGRDGRLYHWTRRPPDDEIADWGTSDPEVAVLLFERDDAPDIALTHFACHPVTVQVQPLVSADFPGVAAGFIEQSGIGVGCCLFLQGACGDINPLRGTTDFDDVKRYGHLLAGEVLKQIARVSAPDYPVAPPRVHAASRTISLASRELPPLSEVEEAHRQGEATVRQAGAEDERRRAERALLGLTERLERVRRGDAPVSAEVLVLRLGDAALVGIPGEPVAELGVSIKRGTSAPTALCLGYANGYIGYIAPSQAWAQGGYEVSLGTWSSVGPQAFGLLLDAAKALVDGMWQSA